MKNTILILALCIFSGYPLHAQGICDSSIYYKRKSDSLNRQYKNLIKLDNLRRVSVLKHAKIVRANPTQAKFIVGWVDRDLR